MKLGISVCNILLLVVKCADKLFGVVKSAMEYGSVVLLYDAIEIAVSWADFAFQLIFTGVSIALYVVL
jgi:hypothetical protein